MEFEHWYRQSSRIASAASAVLSIKRSRGCCEGCKIVADWTAGYPVEKSSAVGVPSGVDAIWIHTHSIVQVGKDIFHISEVLLNSRYTIRWPRPYTLLEISLVLHAIDLIFFTPLPLG